MRVATKLAAAFLVPALAAPAVGSTGAFGSSALPPERLSPPGQLLVVTVNAKQSKVLGVTRFERLHALAQALRSRPPGFDGGGGGAITAPDVILLQEMRSSNVEILQKLINQRSSFNYAVVQAADSPRKFLINSDAVTVTGEPVTWTNPCPGGSDSGREITFFWARLVETATGTSFVSASIHLPRHDSVDLVGCRELGVQSAREQFSEETSPVILGGDFNSRPVRVHRECDPDERTEPREWYRMMTTPLDGETPFVDAVRDARRRQNHSMATTWTHEWSNTRTLCDGSINFQRSRIDYLFATRALTADAHADHPGWAGARPGTAHPDNFKYSDHRFVWGRFIIAGPTRPAVPTTALLADGVVQVDWQPVEGATEYVLYRAGGRKAYSVRGRLPPDTLTFTDSTTVHGRTYRYAVAAVGASGAQGFESRAARATPDAKGPRVRRIIPRDGARRVSRRASVTVRFDEHVSASSVSQRSIELRRKGRRVRGRVERESGRRLVFDPRGRLRNKARYRVIVHPVMDRLGNRGVFFYSSFTT